MCGLAGILYFDEKSLKKFNDHQKTLVLSKRYGSDDQDYKAFNNFTLVHSRLQKPYTAGTCNQPFSGSKNKTGLVFNGEVFNYKAKGNFIVFKNWPANFKGYIKHNA